jgi:hypothetical protein
LNAAVARCIVQTPHGAGYAARLASHWGHKFEVEQARGRTRIVMSSGAVVTLQPDADTLSVTVEAADEAALRTTTHVVAEHLDRFAFREAPLEFDWRPV